MKPLCLSTLSTPLLALLVANVLLLLCLHDAGAQYRKHSGNYPRDNSPHAVNFRPDTVKLEFPEHSAVVRFGLKQYRDQKLFMKNFPALLKEVLDAAQQGIADTAVAQRIHVIFKPHEEKRITLEPATKSTAIVTRGTTLTSMLPPGWEVHLESNDASTYVYAETYAGLQALTLEDFSNVTPTIDSDPAMGYLGKKSIYARLVMHDGKATQSKVEQHYPGDMIALTLGAGIGYVGEKFYPHLEATTGLYFTDHFGRNKFRLEASYNLMVFTQRKTEGGYTSDLNGFLSVSYGYNFNPKAGRDRWAGLGVGYLVNKQGDYFTGNTAKIFFTSDIGSTKLNIVPELYLTDDLKKALYGIKLRYTF